MNKRVFIHVVGGHAHRQAMQMGMAARTFQKSRRKKHKEAHSRTRDAGRAFICANCVQISLTKAAASAVSARGSGGAEGATMAVLAPTMAVSAAAVAPTIAAVAVASTVARAAALASAALARRDCCDALRRCSVAAFAASLGVSSCCGSSCSASSPAPAVRALLVRWARRRSRLSVGSSSVGSSPPAASLYRREAQG